jgi:hypothetical protein
MRRYRTPSFLEAAGSLLLGLLLLATFPIWIPYWVAFWQWIIGLAFPTP